MGGEELRLTGIPRVAQRCCWATWPPAVGWRVSATHHPKKDASCQSGRGGGSVVPCEAMGTSGCSSSSFSSASMVRGRTLRIRPPGPRIRARRVRRSWWRRLPPCRPAHGPQATTTVAISTASPRGLRLPHRLRPLPPVASAPGKHSGFVSAAHSLRPSPTARPHHPPEGRKPNP